MQLAFDVRSHQERLLDQIGFVLTVTLLRALSLLPYGLVRLGSAIGQFCTCFQVDAKTSSWSICVSVSPRRQNANTMSLRGTTSRHVVRSYLERGIQSFGSAQSLNKHVEVDSKIDLHDKDAPPSILWVSHECVS